MTPLFALTIIFAVYALGDIIATKTHAIVSMLMVVSVVFAIGFWNNWIPETIFTDSNLKAFGDVTVGLLLVHMGTTIKIRDFIEQYKTAVIVLCSTLAICMGVYFIGQYFIDREMALVGAPIVGGAIVAFMIMSEAMKNISSDAVLFGSLILVTQGVIGFPIASLLCKKEAVRIKKAYLAGEITVPTKAAAQEEKPRRRLIPQIPEKYNEPNFIIAKLGLVACLAFWLSGLTNGKVNFLLLCLILGVVFTELGFLDSGSLTKANGFSFVIAATIVNVVMNLAGTTPAMILGMIKPLLIVYLIGLPCCGLVSILVGKIFHESWYLCCALSVTALFGFPGTLIVPTEVSRAVAENDEERQVIQSRIMPKMLIAGMVSVSVVSVVVAGIMASWA